LEQVVQFFCEALGRILRMLELRKSVRRFQSVQLSQLAEKPQQKTVFSGKACNSLFVTVQETAISKNLMNLTAYLWLNS
jgi:hypothetical protein